MTNGANASYVNVGFVAYVLYMHVHSRVHYLYEITYNQTYVLHKKIYEDHFEILDHDVRLFYDNYRICKRI